MMVVMVIWVVKFQREEYKIYLLDLLPKINKENDCIWLIDKVARWQNGPKSDF